MLIELDGLNKSYFSDSLETRALREVTLRIDTGDYVAIEGPSGCGKSTLLSILGLLESPSSGAYRLKGKPVDRVTANERARIRNREIGFIFQSFNLLGDLTIAENVELPLIYAGLTRGERKLRVVEVLDQVNMSHRVDHYPGQLSGGQQQRVAVARALARSEEHTSELQSPCR
jgi:putative ABC transport system ATP-binding protein